MSKQRKGGLLDGINLSNYTDARNVETNAAPTGDLLKGINLSNYTDARETVSTEQPAEETFKKKVDTGLSGTTNSTVGTSKPLNIAVPKAEEGDDSIWDDLAGFAKSVKNTLSPAMRTLPVNTLSGAVSFATNLVTGIIKNSISEEDFKKDPYLQSIVNTIEQPSKDLAEAAASVSRAVAPQIELAKRQAGIKEEYINAPVGQVMAEDVGQGFKKLGLAAIENIPQLGAMMLAGGGNKAKTFIAGTTLGTAQSLQEEYQKDKDISGVDLAQSTMKGVIEGLTEMIFDTDLKTAASLGKSIIDVSIDGGKKAIKDLIETEGKKAAREVITRNYKDVVKNGLKGMSEEGLEEVVATGASFVVDTIDSGKLNTKDYEKLKWDLIDAGLIGAAIGGPISVVGAVATKKNLTEEQKVSVKRFQDVANNQDLSPEIRKIAKERIGEIVNYDSDLTDEQYNKLSSLPLDSRIDAFGILSKINSAEDDSRKIKDLTLQEDNKKIIDGYKSDLNAIFEANKPSAAEVVEEPAVLTPEEKASTESSYQEELAKANESFKITMGVPSEPMKVSSEFSIKTGAEDLGINNVHEPSPNMPLEVNKKQDAKKVQFTTKENPDALLEGDVYTVNQNNNKFATILSTNHNGVQEYYVPELDNAKPFSNLDDAKFAVQEKLTGKLVPEVQRSGIDRLRADKFIPKADIVVKSDNGQETLLDPTAKKSIQNAVKAFKSVSSAPVYLYRSTEDFKKGVALELGEDSKALEEADKVGGGFFTNKRDEDSIHINLANLNQTSLAHELFHGTVVNVARQNPSAFAEMRDAIITKLGENDLINVRDAKGNLQKLTAKEYLTLFSNQYSPSQQAEEFLGELTGLLTSDIAKLKDATIWETIKLGIRNLVKSAGIDIPIFEKTANVNDTVKFFNDLAKSLQTGKEINISKLNLKDEKQAAKQGNVKGETNEQGKIREENESLRNDVGQVVEQRRKGNELGKKKRKLSDIAAKAMAIEPTTPEDYALQYFINGGLVLRGSAKETVEKDTLFTLFSKARMGGSTEVVSEMRARVRIVGGRNAGGLSISEIAEKIFAEYQQATKGDVGADVSTAYDYMDFKSAVENTLTGNKSDSGMAATLLASKNKSTEEDTLALTEDEEFEKMRIKAEAESMGMTEQELLDKIAELENAPEIEAVDEAYVQALNMINDEDFAKLYELDDSDIAKIDELMAGVESNQGELDDKLAEQKKAVRDLEAERKKVVAAMEKAGKETQLDITGKAPIQEQLFGADTKSLTDKLQSIDVQLATAKADVNATQSAIDFQERGTMDMFEGKTETAPKKSSIQPLSEKSIDVLKTSRFGGNEQLEARSEVSKEEKILLDGVEVTKEEAIKKSRESLDYETYGSKMEYNGKDSQTKDFVKEYNRRTNPYTFDGQLKGDFIQKGLVKAFNEMSFRKFGDLYRKHIDSFFSKENYQNGLAKNFTWEEKAGYVIGDNSYEGMGDKYKAFAKEAGITIPENTAAKVSAPTELAAREKLEEAKPAKSMAKATELQQEETELVSKPDETVFATIARIIEPNIDEAIEKSKAKAEEKGEPFTKSDAEYIKLSLEYDLLNATGKYLESNDKIVSAKLTRAFNNTFNLNAVIKRNGKDYYFKTKSTLAGGYNVQRYHYRYLVDSNLPKVENNGFDYLKTRISNITKAKDIDSTIRVYKRNIEKYQEEIDTYENMSDEEYLKDWYFKNLTWDDIVKRGADKNYEGGKAEFDKRKADDKKRVLEGRKTRIESAKRNIKSQEAAIAKEQQKKNELDTEYLQEQVDSLRADVSLLNIESEEIGERRNNAYLKLSMHEDKTKVLDAKEVSRLNKLIKELDKEQAPIRNKMSKMREEMQRLNRKSGYNLDLYGSKFQKQGISVAPEYKYQMNEKFKDPQRLISDIRSKYDLKSALRERGKIEGSIIEVERKLTDNIVISALSKIGVVGFKTIGAIENAPLFKAGTGKTVKLKEALTGFAGYTGNSLRNATLKAIQGNNKFAASGARVAASLFGNLSKTNELQARRKALTGSKTDANNDIAMFSKDLNGMIGFDKRALMRVHTLLDPEAFKIIGGENLPTSPADLNIQELRLYNTLRDANDFIHEWHYQNEFIDKPTYEKNKGKYFARMYEEIERKEFADLHDAIDKMPSGADFRMFKARKDFSEIELTLMNDPIYITSKRLATMLHNKATLEFCNAMAADPSYTTYKNKDDIPENNKNGFKLLASKGGGKRYGDLTNKYVPITLYEELRGTTFANDFISKSYDWMRMYDNLDTRQFLKKTKTIYNPTTRLGNITTNFAFAWLAGVDPFTMIKNRVKAKDSLDNYDDWAKDLAMAGILGTDTVVADLMQKKKAKERGEDMVGQAISKGYDKSEDAILNTFKEKFGLSEEKAAKTKKAREKIGNKRRQLNEYLLESYGRTDDVAKISLYRSLVEDYGKSREEAADIVSESMQNYATVGKAYQYFSKMPLIGNPFVKFSSDMARIVANGFANRPLYMASFLGMMYGTARLLSGLSGEPEDEREARESRAFIPKIPLGFTDIPLTWKVGKYEINAARFISPYYVYDAGYRSNTIAELTKFAPIQLSYENKVGFASDYTPVMSDPFIAPLAQIVLDKDFRGLPIADPKDSKYTEQTVTESEARWNRWNYLGNNYASPLWGMISNLYSAAAGKGDIYGRRRDIPSAILNNVIKVQEMESEDIQKAVINQVKYIDSEYKQIKTDITSRRNNDTEEIQKVISSNATEAQKEKQILEIQIDYSNFVEERVDKMNELKIDRQLPLDRLYKIQNPKKND